MMEHGRDASQKAELRERIIMTATEAFTLKGIKCITMETLRQHWAFPNVRSMRFLQIRNHY